MKTSGVVYNVDNRLSLQLFGNPVVVIADIKHVGVEVCEKKLFKVFNCEKIEKTNIRGRCLICYSFISEIEYQGLFRRHGAEQSSVLLRFLRTLASQQNLSMPFDETVISVSSSTSWFCRSCGSVCQQFLSQSRPLRFNQKGQRKQLQDKIIAAIQLSTILAQKEASRNADSDETFHGDTNAILQMRAVDRVREFLIGERHSKSLDLPKKDTFQINAEERFKQLDGENDTGTDEQRDPIQIPPSSESKGAKLSIRFPCDICGVVLSRGLSLRRHKQAVHFKIKQFVCTVCGRGFTLRQGLDIHLRTHTGERPFSCDLCGDSFICKSTLNRHVRVMHQKMSNQRQEKTPMSSQVPATKKGRQAPATKKGRQVPVTKKSGKWNCDICGVVLSRGLALRRHKLAVHFKIKQFACMMCGRGFTLEQGLDIHLRTHTGERPFSCDLCGDSFICKSTLNRHVRVVHEKKKGKQVPATKNASQVSAIKKVRKVSATKKGGKRPTTKKGGQCNCDICGVVLSSKYTLYFHKRVKHRGVKPHVCSYCQKKFAKRQDLIIHARQHTGERPFTCSICGVGFSGKNNLKQHLRRCESRRCNQKTTLGEDGEPTPPVAAKLQLKQELSPSSHVGNTGTVAKNVCDVCLRRFKSKSNLDEHKKVHLLEQPHACTLCPKRFRRKCNLNCHIQTCHPGRTIAEEQRYPTNSFDSLIKAGNGLWKRKFQTLYFCNLKIEAGQDSKWKCPIVQCLYSHRRRLILVQHINKTHVASSHCSHQCDQCEKRFFYRVDLVHHVKEMHKGTKLPAKSGLGKERDKDDSQLSAGRGGSAGDKFSGNVSSSSSLSANPVQVPKNGCSICGAVLSSRSTLYWHKRVKHGGVKPHTCSYCQKKFARRVELVRHTKTHSGKITCPICGRIFAEKESLDQHLIRCNNANRADATMPFKRKHCTKKIRGKGRFSRHVPRRITTVKTPQRTVNFDSLIKAGNGLWKWIEKEGTLYFCDWKIEKGLSNKWKCPLAECPYSSSNRTFLILHINRMHVHPSDCSHQCGQCEERLFYQIDLVEHVEEMHNGDFQGSLTERLEEQQTSTASSLTEKGFSMWEEAGGKLYFCDMEIKKGTQDMWPCPVDKCLNVHGQRLCLIRHINRNHVTDGFKPKYPYKCDECKMKCFSQSELVNHADEKHKQVKVCEIAENELINPGDGLWKEAEEKLYFCGKEIKKSSEDKWACPLDSCIYADSRRLVLIQHINRNHVDPSNCPHRCSQCDKRFYYEADLVQHIQEKHKGGYVCDLCGAKLSSRQTLTSHKRTMHRSNLPHICKYCGKGFARKLRMISHEKTHGKAKGVSNAERSLLEKDLEYQPVTLESKSDTELTVKVEEVKDEPCSDDEQVMQGLDDGECVATTVEKTFALPEALWNTTNGNFDPTQIY